MVLVWFFGSPSCFPWQEKSADEPSSQPEKQATKGQKAKKKKKKKKKKKDQSSDTMEVLEDATIKDKEKETNLESMDAHKLLFLFLFLS